LEQLALTDEDQFAHTFPEFSSNISRLQNIASRLNSMDTMGFEQEVNSIRSKLFEPDQAISTENEFKALEDKVIMRSTGATSASTASLPEDDKAIDEMLPELLPEDSPGEQTSEIPQDQVQPPVQESDTPPDIDIPPEMSESAPQSQEAQPKAETDSETEPTTKVKENDETEGQ
jgi:division protein CdvB (Snf7/Vps24/ESCRT-III family)